MTNTVTLFGLNVEVTFGETFEYTTTSGDVYDQAAVTEDGRLIAWEDGISAWVQLSGNASEVL